MRESNLKSQLKNLFRMYNYDLRKPSISELLNDYSRIDYNVIEKSQHVYLLEMTLENSNYFKTFIKKLNQSFQIDLDMTSKIKDIIVDGYTDAYYKITDIDCQILTWDNYKKYYSKMMNTGFGLDQDIFIRFAGNLFKANVKAPLNNYLQHFQVNLCFIDLYYITGEDKFISGIIFSSKEFDGHIVFSTNQRYQFAIIDSDTIISFDKCDEAISVKLFSQLERSMIDNEILQDNQKLSDMNKSERETYISILEMSNI
jgi:hypothetical protein